MAFIRMLVLPVAALVMGAASAENLMVGGDFTGCTKDLGRTAFSNGGRLSLYQEEYTWNKCGKLEIDRAHTNANGKVTLSAVALVGTDGKQAGVVVKPGQTYDFSLEVRCEKAQHETLGCGIRAVAWEKGIWQDMATIEKVTPGRVVLKPTWTLFRGSFRAPAGKTRAAVMLQLWAQTGNAPIELKLGDCLYFDNLKIEEVQDGVAALKAGATKKAEAVTPRKAVALGETFGDFLAFSRNGIKGAAAEPPVVRVEMKGNDLLVGFQLKSAKPIKIGTAKSPWSGDAFEIFFGPVAGNSDREKTQLAFNAAGARSTSAGSAKGADAWTIERSEVSGETWKGLVRIPLTALGFTRLPQPGERLAFNVALGRAGGELATWAPVVNGFGDVPKFGTLILGTYAEAIRLSYQKSETIATRAAYEARVAELETAARQAELDRFKDLAFTVARIPVDSDFSCPFVPRQCFHPDREINLKGAVNERLGLPIAVLNLRDHVETYVVRLETSTFDAAKPYAEKQFNGTWGLSGFPEGQIVAREGLRFKDTDSAPMTTRVEMLPKMNEACTITVPPGEAGVAWFDFDTTGVKPGMYRGRLRVIPLSEASEWKCWKGVAYHEREYKGQMQDVPVSLEVRPIVLDTEPAEPSAFFQSASTEGMFRLMHELGTRDFMISPWSFQWEKTADGHFDFARPKRGLEKNEREVRSAVAWARARAFRPTFLVGFSSYMTFKGINGLTKAAPEQAIPLWIEYLRGMNGCMNAWGVKDADYAIEVFDEPDPKLFAEAKLALSEAKKALPNVRLVITLGAHVWSSEQLREMDPFIDGWILWQHGYFSRPDHVAYVKDALARGKTVWHYTCGTSGRQPIYPNYRLHPWFAHHHRLTGNYFYIIQNHTGGFGPSDFKVHATSGIIYRSFESTMPSVRYMSMRQGVEDLKYLATLERIAGERPEVKAFLAEATEKVVVSERHDLTTPDRMRERAAEFLLKYAK